jgi:uncharacterized membrane-anchored protein
MTPRTKGLILAVLHAAIVISVGAKLLYDRATQPRVWVETIPVDPDLPIRGRYIRLQLMVTAPAISSHEARRVKLRVENHRLIAEPDAAPSALSELHVVWRTRPGGEAVAILSPPVAFFLPEHARDASVRAHGEELWVEVSVPKKGAPRPIRLGVKKGDAPITPLDVG